MLGIRNTSTTTKTQTAYGNSHLACMYELHTCTETPPEVHPQSSKDVPLVEFMYLVSTCMPGESYHRRLRSLVLYLHYVFQVPIDDLRKSRGLHSVRAFRHGPVCRGPCLQVQHRVGTLLLGVQCARGEDNGYP